MHARTLSNVKTWTLGTTESMDLTTWDVPRQVPWQEVRRELPFGVLFEIVTRLHT